ncbi:MAG: hypothetical protein Kow00121_31190 [Elainellaceae cyanobacterium]
MPEWLIIAVAIVGIVLIMLAFAFLDLIKGVVRAIFAGLFVFILILVVNRFLTPTDSQRPGLAFPPDQDFPAPDSEDLEDFSDYLRGLGEDIDRLVFGEDAPSDQQSAEATRPGDLIYPLPNSDVEQSRIAEQPTRSSQSQSAPLLQLRQSTQPASGSEAQRPVSAMW